jgi:hypothetical protein
MLPAAAFAFMAAIFLVDRLGSRRVPIDFTLYRHQLCICGMLGYAELAVMTPGVTA